MWLYIHCISKNEDLSLHKPEPNESLYFSIVQIITRIVGAPSGPLTLNLDTTGNLYLDDGRYYYYLYENKNQGRKQGSIAKEVAYIYRATLNWGGGFNLFKERVDGNISADNDKKSSSSGVVRLWPNYGLNKYQKIGFIVFGVIVLLFVDDAEKERTRGGD